MKYLKVFENFKEEDIHAICEKYYIANYTINNGVVDVDGTVEITLTHLTELPLKFGKVTGDFHCQANELTSLKGCPTYVGGEFFCYENFLTSLEGCPIYVGGGFNCDNNDLTSLEFCPKEVNEELFSCSDNNITSLEGCPDVTGDFYCDGNELTSLKGCPDATTDFKCSGNLLTSLEYCPVIAGELNCVNNKILDLRGIEKVSDTDNTILYDNPVEEIYDLFPDHQSVIDSLDYNYFRGGNKINKIRLTQALEEIGLECPENIEGYVWE